ncbi:MAG: hypothetical protein Q4A98_05925 [Comamonadaceae bacterium]|nr:hypothetical protein [Comamonadaceae bacterium]
MTDIFWLLWLADVAQSVRGGAVFFMFLAFVLLLAAPLVADIFEVSMRQVMLLITTLCVLGFCFSLFPSPLTVRIAAASVAAEREVNTEIGQQVKDAVLDALRRAMGEGDK